MSSRPFRVLLDLSLTTEGFSGIPQVTRLLYRLFRRMPEVDVTGLLYCPRGANVTHRFSNSPIPGERLANQALFLEAITSRQPPLSTYRLISALQHINRFCQFVLPFPCRAQELDSEAFWDVLWRNYMKQSLAAEDTELIKSGKFLLSTYSNRAMNMRVQMKTPAQKLDTAGYDFMLFQDARIARVHPETTKLVRYHDMIPVLRPDCLTARRTIKLHHSAVRSAVQDCHFVCNTNHTAKDLCRAYPHMVEQSSVIPYPLSNSYFHDEDEEHLVTILRTRQANAFGESPDKVFKCPLAPYVISVSTLEPRKNYASILQAFTRLNAQYNNVLRLVVVGNRGWKWEGLEAQFKPLIKQGQVIHLANVGHEEMRVLYTHARALVFASYYEGYGLAPVEAMQCQTPVVLSDVSSHRDVAGDAALYCNPYDVDSIRTALWRLLFSEEAEFLRNDLIWRGRKQLRGYSDDVLKARWLELFEKLKPGLRTTTISAPAPAQRLAPVNECA